MLKKNHNYKMIIGVFFGALLSLTVVYAATIYNGTDIYYNNSNSNLTSTTVQGALDELYSRQQVTTNLLATIGRGDYVSYTPPTGNYTVTAAQSGSNSNQIINVGGGFSETINGPTLWRIINVNADGTVEILSNRVSGNGIILSGKVGFQNLIKVLNDIAGAFEKSGITVGHRHFGYDGQIETLTDTSKFNTGLSALPWSCATGYTCSPAPVESQGGGDMLYMSDYNAANNIGALTGYYGNGVNSSMNYHVASRKYQPQGSYYYFMTRYIDSNGNLTAGGLLTCFVNGSCSGGGSSLSVRPIVILKSGLTWSGSGTYSDPWVVS